MKKQMWFLCVVLICMASLCMAAEPLLLDWGTVDTSSEEARTSFSVLKAAAKTKQLSLQQKNVASSQMAYVVQFGAVAQESWKDALVAAGATIQGYIPENAFLVLAGMDAIAKISDMPEVYWVGEWLPQYKQNRDIRSVLAKGEETAKRVRVVVFSPADVEAIAAAISSLPDCNVENVTAAADRGLVRATLPPSAINEVGIWAEVEWIEPYVTPTLRNDVAVKAPRMNVTNVWADLGLTGAGQVVAVCDTGLDSGNKNTIHPDFSGRIKWTQALGRSTWNDTDGHGTHVAGSVLGSGAASSGQYKGVAYEAQLVFQSVLDSSGYLTGIPDDLQTLFQAAYTNGARVHSDSWGVDDNGAYTADSRYTDMYMWNNPDMLVLIAAGNSGIDSSPKDGIVDLGSVGSPATAKNCLSVGASENYRPEMSAYTYGSSWPNDYPKEPIYSDEISAPDTPVGMSAFSSRGPCQDGRIKPDIIAPGTDIISPRSRATSDEGWGVAPNTNYLYMGGTSMATPLTAGAVTLVRQWLIEERGYTSPSAALMKGLIINGARNMAPGQYGTGSTQEIPTVRPSNVQGWGHVDLANTLILTGDQFLDLHEGTLATGQSTTYVVTNASPGTNNFVVTLAYTDYYPASGSGKKLVNDLDVTVKTPGGTTLYANGSTSRDSVNNVEMIEFVADEVGFYTITVNAYAVNQGGSQPYALVVRGVESTLLPVFTGTGDYRVGYGRPLHVQLSIFSQSDYSVTYSGTPASANWSFNTNTLALTYTPVFSDIGAQTFTFIASNAEGISTGRVNVVVTDPSAPILADIPSQTIPVGYELEYTLDVTELDGDELTLTCENSTTASYLFDDEDGYFLFIPADGEQGEHVFTFTASDVDGSSSKTMTVTVVDAPKFEDFEHFTETDSSYGSGSFLGQDGSIWTYTNCRGDVDTSISSPTPCMAKTTGVITSGTLYGGISSIKFKSMQAFSGTPNCQVYVNDVVVGSVTSGAQGSVQEASFSNINIGGSFVLKFVNTAGQLSIDDIEWTGYSATPTPPVFSAAPTGLTVMVGNSISFSVSASGNPTPVITFTEDTAAGVASFATNRLTYTPDAADVAASPVQFTFVANNANGSATQVVTVAVTPFVATPPAFNPVPEQMARVGKAMSFLVSATGNPVPSLSLTSSSAASGDYTFSASTGMLTFTAPSEGTYTFAFKAENSAGTDTLTVSVVASEVSDIHYGVYVGINDYPGTVNDLNSCIADATTMRTNMSYYGKWEAANQSTLTDSGATKTAIRRAISNMIDVAVSGDVALFYYSGHGGQNSGNNGRDTYLAVYDASYQDYELAADLAKFASGVRVIIVVDACHSAGLFKSMDAAAPWNLAARVTEIMNAERAAKLAAGDKSVESKVNPNEIGWITAADYDESSWTGSPYSEITGHWSKSFVSGDSDGDGGVTFLEMHNYTIAQSGLGSSPQATNTTVLASVFARTPLADQPPAIVVSGDTSKTAICGETLTFSVMATDSDGLALSMEASGLPTGAVAPVVSGVGSVTTTFEWTPTLAQVGVYTVRFTATDKDGSRYVNVSIRVKDGTGGMETFDGLSEETASSAYQAGAFVGQDGSTWTYGYSRNDEGVNGYAITLGKTANKLGWVRSGTLPGGVDSISLSYAHNFSDSAPNATVYVNGNAVGTISTSPSGTSTWGVDELKIEGAFVLMISNNASSPTRLSIDDIEWSGYVGGPSVPVFSAIPPQTGVVGDMIEFDAADYVSGSPAPTVTLLSSTAPSAEYLEDSGYVVFEPTATGTYTFTFEASNTEGTAEGTVTVVVTDAPVYVPVVSASSITTSSFTADWTACTGATSYQIQVATNDFSVALAKADAVLLSEDFSGFTNNISTDVSTTLNKVTQTPGWSGDKVFCATNTARMGSNKAKGHLTTPALGADGDITVVFTAYTEKSPAFTVSHAADGSTFSDVVSSITLTSSPATYTCTFANATSASKIKFANSGTNQQFYLASVVVTSGGASSGYIVDETTSLLTYDVTGLEPETTYYVRVRMADGEWSTVVLVTTLSTAGKTDFESWMDDYTFSDGADLTATGDADGDGFTNGEEYTAGTDPSAASEFPQVEAVTTSTLTIDGISGRTYTAEWVSELVDVDWDETAEVLDAETPASDGPVELDIYKADTTAGFIRVIIEGPTP